MEPKVSASASGEMSKNLFDLNLPEVGPGEGPKPLSQPSYELAREHALFLLRSRTGAEARKNQTPCPEPFVLD